jgi:hypothetical protein
MSTIINATTTNGVVIQPDNSGSLQLQNAGTAAVTIDAGLVGIGTTTPTGALLHVSSSSDTTYRQTKTGQSDWGLQTLDSGAWRLYSYTASAERMRINSTGTLLVGATSLPASAGSAKIFSSDSIGALNGFYCKAGGAATTFGNQFNINWTGSAQLWIDTSNIGTIAFTSDYRIKRNIETQTAPALERVMALRPVTYQMADYGTLFKANDDIKEGFIAHEVQEVIPSGAEGVKDAENQIQSLRVDAILAVAVKAIQEQQTIINDLKARIETLEAK